METKNEKQGLKVDSHAFAIFGQGLDSDIEKPITLILSVSMCVRKLSNLFYQFKHSCHFRKLTTDGWTDGRTRKSIIGHTPKSASNAVGRILLGCWGRHHIREANDIFKEH